MDSDAPLGRPFPGLHRQSDGEAEPAAADARDSDASNRGNTLGTLAFAWLAAQILGSGRPSDDW